MFTGSLTSLPTLRLNLSGLPHLPSLEILSAAAKQSRWSAMRRTSPGSGGSKHSWSSIGVVEAFASEDVPALLDVFSAGMASSVVVFCGF